MNNNRGSNRRRGRGNNRQQGGNQGNRIDSRARGNAPQLLEKYKKLAHDASLNGDRVQAEYYLQFADHYFRVLADSRAQKDDPRGPRREGEREPSYHEDDRFDDQGPRGVQHDRREVRDDRDREPAERDETDGGGESDGFEPVENPFTRENRARRPDEERQPRPARRTPTKDDAEPGEADVPSLDPSLLPPSFSASESEPAPRRKPRRTRSTGGEGKDKGDEELETVS